MKVSKNIKEREKTHIPFVDKRNDTVNHITSDCNKLTPKIKPTPTWNVS